MEALELRLLLDATLSPHLTQTGTLVVSGTPASDRILVSASPSGQQIIVTENGSQTIFAGSIVRRIFIDARAGDDVVTNSVKLNSTILGGDSNDTLTGGPYNDSIDGGAGNDLINSGRCRMFEANTITGGGGDDFVDFSDRTEGMDFKIGSQAPFPAPPMVADGFVIYEHDIFNDLPATLGGTNHDDSFDTGDPPEGVLSPSITTLLGRGGNDYFAGAGLGTQGRLVIGGSGNDTFNTSGEPETTTLLGGKGNDRFVIHDTLPRVDGGSGIDAIQVDENNSTHQLDLNDYTSVENAIDIAGQRVIGTDGPNLLQCAAPQPFRSALRNTLLGRGGNDTLIGSAAADSLDGAQGDDLLVGAGANDTLHGGPGNDTLIGGKGKDRLYGDEDDDLLLALDRFRDTLYGGDGADAVRADKGPTIFDLLGSDIETIL